LQATRCFDRIALERRRIIVTEYRIEKDTMGDVKVPRDAYYGAQTQRAVENFPVSGQRLPRYLSPPSRTSRALRRGQPRLKPARMDP